MLYGDSGGYGSASGSIGMHAGGSAGSSIGSGFDSAAFAPPPSAPAHPPNRRNTLGGWFPWQQKAYGATTTTSASTWESVSASGGQRGSSREGSRSSSISKPGLNTGTGNKGDLRSNGRENSGSSGVGASVSRWWRGVFGGGSAVPGSGGEASKLMTPSPGSLSRLGDPSPGEATYSLRGDGRGPRGRLLLQEELAHGAYETDVTFVPSAGPHLREEACVQADSATDR